MYETSTRKVILLQMLKYRKAADGILCIVFGVYGEENKERLMGFLLALLDSAPMRVREGSEFEQGMQKLCTRKDVCTSDYIRPRTSRLVAKYRRLILALVSAKQHSRTPIRGPIRGPNPGSRAEQDFLVHTHHWDPSLIPVTDFVLWMDRQPWKFNQQEFLNLLWAILQGMAWTDYPSWLQRMLIRFSAVAPLHISELVPMDDILFWGDDTPFGVHNVIDVQLYFDMVLVPKYLVSTSEHRYAMRSDPHLFVESGVDLQIFITGHRAPPAVSSEIESGDILRYEQDITASRITERLKIIRVCVERFEGISNDRRVLSQLREILYSKAHEYVPDFDHIDSYGIARHTLGAGVLRISAAAYAACSALVRTGSCYWDTIHTQKMYLMFRAVMMGMVDRDDLRRVVYAYMDRSVRTELLTLVKLSLRTEMANLAMGGRFFSKLPVFLRRFCQGNIAKGLVTEVHQMDYSSFEVFYRTTTLHQTAPRIPISCLVNIDDANFCSDPPRMAWKSEFTVFLFSSYEVRAIELYEGMRALYRFSLRRLIRGFEGAMNVSQEDELLDKYFTFQVVIGSFGLVTYMVMDKTELEMHRRVVLPFFYDDPKWMMESARALLLEGELMDQVPLLILGAVFRRQRTQASPMTEKGYYAIVKDLPEGDEWTLVKGDISDDIRRLMVWILFQWRDCPEQLWADMNQPFFGPRTTVRHAIYEPNFYHALAAMCDLSARHYVTVVILYQVFDFLDRHKKAAGLWLSYWKEIKLIILDIRRGTDHVYVTRRGLFYLYSFCAFPRAPSDLARALFLHISLRRYNRWNLKVRCEPEHPMVALPPMPPVVRPQFSLWLRFALEGALKPILECGTDFAVTENLSRYHEYVMSRGYDYVHAFFLHMLNDPTLIKHKYGFPVCKLNIKTPEEEMVVREGCSQDMLETILMHPISFLVKKVHT